MATVVAYITMELNEKQNTGKHHLSAVKGFESRTLTLMGPSLSSRSSLNSLNSFWGLARAIQAHKANKRIWKKMGKCSQE